MIINLSLKKLLVCPKFQTHSYQLLRLTGTKTTSSCCKIKSSVICQQHLNFNSSSHSFFHEDNKTKSLSLINNVKQVKNSPIAALTLGFCGITPFIATPVYMISNGIYLPYIDMAQLAYGACILSFIGGVRWGLTMPEGSTQGPDWHNLGYSVLPPLVAWAGLLASPTIGSMTLIGGLALTGYMDIAMWGYPNWYKGIRFCFTFIAILSLWTSLMCKYILLPKDSNNNSKRDL